MHPPSKIENKMIEICFMLAFMLQLIKKQKTYFVRCTCAVHPFLDDGFGDVVLFASLPTSHYRIP